MKVKDWRIISTYDAKRNRNKYGNQKTEVDGVVFDSKKEAQRWSDLKYLEYGGYIHDVQRQVAFELVPAYPPEFKMPMRYIADFTYRDQFDRLIVEDVKSDATKKNRAYRMKKHLMKHIYGIDIKEV